MKSVQEFVAAFGEVIEEVGPRQSCAVVLRPAYGPQAGIKTFLAADPNREMAYAKAAGHILAGVGGNGWPDDFGGPNCPDFIVLTTTMTRKDGPQFFVSPVSKEAYDTLAAASPIDEPDEFKRTASWWSLMSQQNLNLLLMLIRLAGLRVYPDISSLPE